METNTGATAPIAGSPPASEEDPRFTAAREAGNGDTGREMLEHAAQGAELSESEEKSALDWLLGEPVAIPHEIPVTLETPAGMREMTFHVKQGDPFKIDEIEQKHLDRATGRMNQLACDMELVATLCDSITDASGRQVEITSSEFRTVRLRNRASGKVEDHTFADPVQALERRFRGQQGVLSGVARELRRISGFEVTRVGQAQRRLVEASLG